MNAKTEILQKFVRENLRNWFKKEKWKRIDTQGNIKGDCGTMPKGKKTQRCLPAAKARSLTKKQRAATSRKKTRSNKQFVSNTKKAKVKLKEMDKAKLLELKQLFEKLCAKGKAYAARRKAAGEKHGAYLMGRAVKVCKGQIKGENLDEIEAKNDTEFKLSLKHLLKKHVDKGGEIDEVDMTINEVLTLEIDESITEAKYKGKTVKLNSPMRGDSKKFKVYVANGKNKDGSIKVKKVNFGHGGTSAKKRGEKTLKIRKSNPKARAAFRARHRCDNPGPKTMARYWSCRKW
jgi:hypothetical protein